MRPLLAAQSSDRLRLVSAESVVGMGDKPSYALRHRKDSSMYRAIAAVADGDADAAISAGNTGALMAMGRYLLHTHHGIDRPAIATRIPTREGYCYMLDLGANVDCSAEHLCQFALLGAALSEALDGRAAPRVALLNVGEEEIKGSEQVKLASRLLRERSGLNYVGYVEGDGIYAGRVDVVVCDGFVGNVALKSSEGLARLLGQSLRQAFEGSLYRRLVGLLARPIIDELKGVMDPSRHNGASLLGLQKTLVKSHGSADRRCFAQALRQARLEVIQQVPAITNAKLAQLI
jgi:glycerol-3-phosphate acyltransferase PlsX